jgi:hypothetical protein
MVVHAYNSNIQEAEAMRIISSRSAWMHSEILKKTNKKAQQVV